jgi:hypothetical protein
LDKGNKAITVPAIDMRNSLVTTILLAVLALSALISVFLCWRFISDTREKNALQSHANEIIYKRNWVTAVANDTLEYSKTHPAIDPLLETLGFKQGKSTPAANSKPASK